MVPVCCAPILILFITLLLYLVYVGAQFSIVSCVGRALRNVSDVPTVSLFTNSPAVAFSRQFQTACKSSIGEVSSFYALSVLTALYQLKIK